MGLSRAHPVCVYFLLNFLRPVWDGTVQSVAPGSNAICLRPVFVLIPIAISCDRHLPWEDGFSFAVAAVLCSGSPVAVVALPQSITLTSCSTPFHCAFKTAERGALGKSEPDHASALLELATTPYFS